MKRVAMAVVLGTALLLSGGQADAQWRYTDDKGTTKVTQYKLDVPAPFRDAAVWIGPTGIGNPALSAEQIRVAQLADAVRRIVEAEAGLLQFRNAEAPPPPRMASPSAGRPMATMCIAGELRVMTSPGIWKAVGACDSRFSTGYGTEGYGSSGRFIVR